MPYRKTPPDPPARSAELLRLALPQMSRQTAGVHPISYAVWYEHLAGRHAALHHLYWVNGMTTTNDAISKLLELGSRLRGRGDGGQDKKSAIQHGLLRGVGVRRA